ncbi:MAG: DUF2177 family protein [Aquabacterium sp.]|uniref:DUF2177 family protein n=1 Tax=Aquabacterium sp. TaxID=1872578 RepID=UPI00271A6180|nr:DUF2177 family protein [Aquabacterium sp.]MDO9004410.1 DUF2177 family protein [Aquabacterium sp.]
MKYLQIYGGIAVVMLVLDMVWLGFIAKAWYQQGIGHLMSAQPNMAIGALFYLLFPLGLTIFAVLPTGDDPGWTKAALMGALFGFFAYATYDITNLATLRDWPIKLSIIDVAWGSLVSGLAAGAGKAVQVHVGHV